MELSDIDRKVIDFLMANPRRCGCGAILSGCSKIKGVRSSDWTDCMRKLKKVGLLNEHYHQTEDLHCPSSLLKLAALGYLPEVLNGVE